MKKFEMLIDDFTTKQEQLDQFKQNDEKEYDDDEWIRINDCHFIELFIGE